MRISAFARLSASRQSVGLGRIESEEHLFPVLLSAVTCFFYSAAFVRRLLSDSPGNCFGTREYQTAMVHRPRRLWRARFRHH